MSEEEIKILKVLINSKDIFYYEDDFNNRIRPLVGKLLNLYEDEKEKNRYLKAQIPRGKIMNEEEKNVLEYFKNKQVYDMELVFDYIPVLLNLIEKQQKELNNLKEIEQEHKTENGLLRQELDMQIEHNKELDNILYAKQSMIDELTQNEEQLKIELGKEKENLKIAVAMLTKGTYPEENEGDNDFNKKFIAVDKIKEMKKYREFELQQEYKEFEEDAEWRTYKKILEV